MSSQHVCPLCQSPNLCKLVEDPAAKTCWCMQIKIPQTTLEAIPAEHIRRACICQKCAQESTSFNSQGV